MALLKKSYFVKMTPHCGTQALVLHLLSSGVLLRRRLKFCSGDPKAVCVEIVPSSSIITSKEQVARVNFQKKTCFCFPFHWGKQKFEGGGRIFSKLFSEFLFLMIILHERA